MKFYLLDGVAAGFVLAVAIFYMIITIILEAVTMNILKYNKAGKSFLDSLVVNLASFMAGFAILSTGTGLFEIVDSATLSIAILFLITVAVELLVLYVLNQNKPFRKTIIAAVVINIVTYGIYYILQLFVAF